MRKSILFTVACLVFCLHMVAQGSRVPGQFIIQFNNGVSARDWVASWNNSQDSGYRISKWDELVSPHRIFLVEIEQNGTNLQPGFLEKLMQAPGIALAQYNHKAAFRGIPNDALFSQQWQYNNTGQTSGLPDADIDATEAWDIATGGLTASGDTIVIAIIDNGIDLSHPDLQSNRWYNYAEVPANGLDDDNNGYTDDYLGWNVMENNDNIQGGGHGTPVASIAGADGNNGIGVSGVNWQVKLMIIKMDLFGITEARVLEAYAYALEQRLRYNQSNGLQGAFVVASNSSWGVDEAMPEEAPIWCSFYDLLGQAGIINCTATANENFNVDIVGDLPTACPSDYLIAVTNTDHIDQKVGSAGYGLTSIDVGAPGQGVFTAVNNGGYGTFGGTSAATPHVSGIAALLYSLDCPSFMALVKADPAAAALVVKESILAGADPLPALNGITVTGGRVNALGSILYLQSRCNSCFPAGSVSIMDRTDTEAILSWLVNDSLSSVGLRVRVVGNNEWFFQQDGVSSPLQIMGLQPCTSYEYQLTSTCRDGTVPGDDPIYTFRTDGCCEAPEGVVLTPTSNSVSLRWNPVLAAQSYEIRYRQQGSTEWVYAPTTEPEIRFDNIEPCEFFDFQVRTICANGSTEWNSSGTFVTSGCGPCLELDYCTNLNDIESNEEFIQQVEIGDFFQHTSSWNFNGYENFGQIISAIPLEIGKAYPLRLTPGFPTATTFLEYWRVWIDFDHNGGFTSGEIVFDSNQGSREAVLGTIAIPETALSGITRMRIMMQFAPSPSSCPLTTTYGEMEDYCVDLERVCYEPGAFHLVSTNYSTATVAWEAPLNSIGYEAAYREELAGVWMPLPVDGNQVVINNLDSCLDYTLRVRSQCREATTSTYGYFDFNTCTVGTNQPQIPTIGLGVYPNPFTENITVHLQNISNQQQLEISLFDALGRKVVRLPHVSTANETVVDMAAWPNGLYLLVVSQNGIPVASTKITKLATH